VKGLNPLGTGDGYHGPTTMSSYRG